jgi:predicted aspartyl protease
VEARADKHLLAVKAVLNGSEEGYFLLDTGATFSAISHRLARALHCPRGLSTPLSLQGGARPTKAARLAVYLSEAHTH